MTAIEPLVYPVGCKEMKVEPVNFNMDSLASIIKGGSPAAVILEPGDATHYSLLIVPVWSQYIYDGLGRFGIPSSRAGDYLVVTKLAQERMFSCWLPLHQPLGVWHMSDLVNNEWSQMFLSWWFNHLQEEMGLL